MSGLKYLGYANVSLVRIVEFKPVIWWW